MGKVKNIPSDSDWDEHQRRVIKAVPGTRLLVEAGPGTGKTAVACARLAHLINEDDIEPNKTWMISFTRAAVAEIRARLYSYVGDASFAIKIATIDSHAWSIHSGYDPNAKLTGSYETNIERVIELLKTEDDISDELARIEHVIIDEAQDLVGRRADLIVDMIERLSPDAGVTVFADEAQGIYGFSDSDKGSQKGQEAKKGKPLLSRLVESKGSDFDKFSLTEIHRTTSPRLQKIFAEVRKDILDSNKRRVGLNAETAEKIRRLADKSGVEWRKMKVASFGAEDLLLFRYRAEVLMASQFCTVPHRLRMSGYGESLPAWLAICFWDFEDKFLAKQKFFETWSERIESKTTAHESAAEAWRLMVRVAGLADGSVDMLNLRSQLGRSRPPIEFTLPEYGLPGPIVGTIHASKGREASNVVLLLPPSSEFESIDSEAEEARVLFVGATRAKSSLIVGEGVEITWSTLRSKRIYRTTRFGKSMVEIGRAGDIAAHTLVGRSEFSESEARLGQTFLEKVTDVAITYKLKVDGDLDWRYRIHADDMDDKNTKQNKMGPCVGTISSSLTNDLWEMLRNRKKDKSCRPPSYLNYIRGQGCATIALRPDDNELETLNEPWASSGFVLAPRIVAFPTFKLPKR